MAALNVKLPVVQHFADFLVYAPKRFATRATDRGH